VSEGGAGSTPKGVLRSSPRPSLAVCTPYRPLGRGSSAGPDINNGHPCQSFSAGHDRVWDLTSGRGELVRMKKEADSSELRDKETARGDHRPVRGDTALLCVIWRDSAAQRASPRRRRRLDCRRGPRLARGAPGQAVSSPGTCASPTERERPREAASDGSRPLTIDIHTAQRERVR